MIFLLYWSSRFRLDYWLLCLNLSRCLLLSTNWSSSRLRLRTFNIWLFINYLSGFVLYFLEFVILLLALTLRLRSNMFLLVFHRVSV